MTDTDRLARIEKLLAQQVTATMRLVALMEEASRAGYHFHTTVGSYGPEFSSAGSGEVRRLKGRVA